MKILGANGLIGSADALDHIPEQYVEQNDVVLVKNNDVILYYKLHDSVGGDTDLPWIVKPSTSTTSKRWVLIDIPIAVPIPNGVTEMNVVLPIVVNTSSYSPFVSIENTVDTNPSMYQCIVTDKTTGRFTVKFSGVIDSANYTLNWLAK